MNDKKPLTRTFRETVIEKLKREEEFLRAMLDEQAEHIAKADKAVELLTQVNELLVSQKHRMYNPFEPDNQSESYYKVVETISIVEAFLKGKDKITAPEAVKNERERIKQALIYDARFRLLIQNGMHPFGVKAPKHVASFIESAFEHLDQQMRGEVEGK